MKPKTLSASAVKAFEACPAMFRAKYIQKAPDPAGDPALRGTVIHAVLEDWVAGGYYLAPLTPTERTDKIRELVDRNYWLHLDHGGELEFCFDQCIRWVERTDFVGRTVLSTETKMRFDLPTSAGMIPFTYIIDRIDRLDDGDVEVTDYKSWIRNISAAELRWDIQARVYALAAWIQHRDAELVWVTFDQTRWSDIGTSFTHDDCRLTWRYLKNVAERILASDGSEERLNDDCRFCPRKKVCRELKRHAQAGGEMASDDVVEAAERRHATQAQIKALEQMVADLDRFLLEHADRADVLEFAAGEVEVSIGSRSSRSVDQGALVRILGDDVAQFVLSYGGLTMSAVDKALKERDPWLPAATTQAISGLVEDKFAGLRVATSAISPVLRSAETPA